MRSSKSELIDEPVCSHCTCLLDFVVSLAYKDGCSASFVLLVCFGQPLKLHAGTMGMQVYSRDSRINGLL
jgi:hypothetical protein